jgi:deoxyribose-phosphate aldolase
MSKLAENGNGSDAGGGIPAENRRILDLIDFTLLDHHATPTQLELFCSLANQSQPAAICVFAEHVQFVKSLIDPHISIAAVAAGFPIGSESSEEIKSSILVAVEAGANEIDCVLEPRIENDFPGSLEENKLRAMREASGDLVLKVILETSLLNENSIRTVSQMALRCGADFLKTSTGKRGGCTAAAASFLAEEANNFHQTSGFRRGVKLSGGIRSVVGANELLTIVLDKYPAIIGNGTTLCDLTREDSKRLRIGASGILEELMPSLYQNEPQSSDNKVRGESENDKY